MNIKTLTNIKPIIKKLFSASPKTVRGVKVNPSTNSRLFYALSKVAPHGINLHSLSRLAKLTGLSGLVGLSQLAELAELTELVKLVKTPSGNNSSDLSKTFKLPTISKSRSTKIPSSLNTPELGHLTNNSISKLDGIPNYQSISTNDDDYFNIKKLFNSVRDRYDDIQNNDLIKETISKNKAFVANQRFNSELNRYFMNKMRNS